MKNQQLCIGDTLSAFIRGLLFIYGYGVLRSHDQFLFKLWLLLYLCIAIVHRAGFKRESILL
jgi:hypothetical protein